MEPNEIHQSIAQQVDHMKPDHLRPGIDVGMEVVDDATLRVLLPYRGAHVDVRYDAGPDTYTVTRTDTVKLGALVMPCERDPISDVYCDQLGEMVFGDDAKSWTQPFGGIVDMDTGETIAEF